MPAYAIILACLTAVLTVTVILLAVKLYKIKKADAEKAPFYDVMSESENTAYIIIDAADSVPKYISEGITKLFGLDIETVSSDVYSLMWCVDDDQRRTFEKLYGEWDRVTPLTSEFEFVNLETKQPCAGRAVISMYGDEYLEVKIDNIAAEMEIRKNLHDEIERIKTEEQHKSDFLSKMSHEIRTPMNGILGMMTLAKNNIEKPEELLRCIDKAHGLAQLLLTLINDILDMSKIESGKVVLEDAVFDLFEIYDKLSEMFHISAEQKGIDFQMRREDMDVRYVKGDSLRLLQTLVNFVSNAIKYTSKGGNITITFKQMNKTGETVHMLFDIKDTGRGMDPKFLNRIFKPFEQETASTTRKYGGTGLGMAIADNLVRLMGGHIVVDTALGKGSDFSVYIPFGIAPVEQTMEDEPEHEEVPQNVSLDGLKVLMAEDNAINAEIAAELFRMEGADIDIAENGKIAVEMFKSHPDNYYDIVFMDILMPELDGWAATKLIRGIDSEYARTVPIFALSANAFVEDKRHSVEVGMNGHISKPIDFDELKATVAGSLKK